MEEVVTFDRTIDLQGQKVKLGSSPSVSLRCAYLGPEGTYGHQAAGELLGEQAQLSPVTTNSGVVEAVGRRDFELGLVPTENSIEGSVTESIRALIHSERSESATMRILAEKVLPVNHILFGTPEAFKKQILRSHPQAISQCSKWINENLAANAVIVRENSTAEAVQRAKENDEMAIGNELAGKIYEAPVLQERITDLTSNHTRFWLLGYGDTEPTGDDRVAMVFTLKNEAGALVDAFMPFAKRQISICKVDTLPLGTLDEYYFLMSIDGHHRETRISDAIRDLQERVWKVKVLGSFKKDRTQVAYDPEALGNGWIDLTTL